MFTKEQYEELTPDDKGILHEVATGLLSRTGYGPRAEIWKFPLDMYDPDKCDGCVPDSWITDGDIESLIEAKFAAIVETAMDMVANVMPHGVKLSSTISPSYEDCTEVLVTGDDDRVYYRGEAKAWNYLFDNLYELAEEVRSVAREILEKGEKYATAKS